MIKSIIKFFSGDTVKSIENIASEWIETSKEEAEAKTLMVKALDPNGAMRRDLSKKVSMLYSVFIFASISLLFCEGFGIGEAEAISNATSKLTELFAPITTLFGAIVTTSFGVNYANIRQRSKD